MGSTSWSDAAYSMRSSTRASGAAATGTSVKDATFAYHSSLRRAGKALVVHEKLDPKSTNKNGAHAGKNIRESLDSDAHPESVAVAIIFDTTGSMQFVPTILQEKLPKLMGLLVRKNYLEHPQILFGAINDMHASSRVPLQIGQFEAGLEIDDDLTNLLLEGAGGGSIEESYELGLYFMAKHTYIDCFEKRGKKGYLFIIGDESPYPNVEKDQVEKTIGDILQSDLATADVVEELLEKWEAFYIMPGGTAHSGEARILDRWKKMLGQNVLELANASQVCECIAAQIGLYEGKTDSTRVANDLIEAGTDKHTAAIVSKALVTTGSGAPAAIGTVVGGSLTTDVVSDDVTRI